MPDQFKELAKNNGLKNVVWGSEQFVQQINRTIQREKEKYIGYLAENGASEIEVMEAIERDECHINDSKLRK